MEISKLNRSIATPLTIVTSLVVLATGSIMYFAFKNKILEEIHAQIGIVLIVATVLHLIVNAKPLVNHLKRKVVYLLAVPVVIFAVVIALMQSGGAGRGGGMNPGMIFKQLERSNVETLSALFETNPEQVIQRLAKNGIVVSSANESIQSIAQKNQKSPREVLSYFVSEKRN